MQSRRTWAMVSGIVVFLAALVAVCGFFNIRSYQDIGNAFNHITQGISQWTGGPTYSASVPGPGCDSGDGSWTAPDDGSTSVACTSSYVTVTKAAAENSIAELYFNWPEHSIVNGFTSTVTVSPQESSCGGMGAQDGDYHAYAIYVCDDGYWEVIGYDDKGQPTKLDHGTVSNKKQSYQVRVSYGSNTVTLSIEDAVSKTYSDSSSYVIQDVTLDVENYQNQDASAQFSDFQYQAKS